MTLGYPVESTVPLEYAEKYGQLVEDVYPVLKAYLNEETFPIEEEPYGEEQMNDDIETRSYPRDDSQQRWPCNIEEVKKINEEILSLLKEYPKKSPIEMSIDTLFNEERKQLAEAFTDNKWHQHSNCNKAKKIIEDFLTFVNRFNDIRNRILAAVDRLQAISSESSYSTQIQCDALQLIIALNDVDSLHIAERILQEYDKFNNTIQSSGTKQTMTETDSNDNKKNLNIKTDDAQ